MTPPKREEWEEGSGASRPTLPPKTSPWTLSFRPRHTAKRCVAGRNLFELVILSVIPKLWDEAKNLFIIFLVFVFGTLPRVELFSIRVAIPYGAANPCKNASLFPDCSGKPVGPV